LGVERGKVNNSTCFFEKDEPTGGGGGRQEQEKKGGKKDNLPNVKRERRERKLSSNKAAKKTEKEFGWAHVGGPTDRVKLALEKRQTRRKREFTKGGGCEPNECTS